jgi:cation diffusion facilitator family transporter
MKKKRAARIALFGGIAVLSIKLLAFLLSNSVALLSDALESIVNIGASGLMLFSVYVSEKPADESHDYGHQKIEDISSMVEGIFIIAAALLIIYSAVGRLFEFSALFELNLAIIVSILATVLNGGISWFLTRTSRETKSSALEGDAKHLLSDVISSVGIWVGLFVVQLTGWYFMDSVMAFVVAGLVARMGAGLVIKSSHLLMDKSCEEEEKKINEILDRHRSQFIEFHNLRTRRQGTQVFGDLHLTVDGSLSVKDAHDFTDHLERNLKEKMPYLDLTIHVETRD